MRIKIMKLSLVSGQQVQYIVISLTAHSVHLYLSKEEGQMAVQRSPRTVDLYLQLPYPMLVRQNILLHLPLFEFQLLSKNCESVFLGSNDLSGVIERPVSN